MMKSSKFVALAASAILVAACQTTGDEGATTTDSSGTTDSGTTTGSGGTGGGGSTTGTTGTTGGSTGGGTGTGIPALVNVNLQNVLNNLSVALNVEQANIPVNAQVPVSVAANVCGVSVNVLSVSTGGQASCTAKTTSPELVQVVQQQISAGGNVGGGDQTTTPPPTGN
jgi:hypothetical protein